MYTVICTKSVAEEMIKYEENSIIKTEFFDVPEWTRDTQELEKMYARYKFTISGTPNISRWKSFNGVIIFPSEK